MVMKGARREFDKIMNANDVRVTSSRALHFTNEIAESNGVIGELGESLVAMACSNALSSCQTTPPPPR